MVAALYLARSNLGKRELQRRLNTTGNSGMLPTTSALSSSIVTTPCGVHLTHICLSVGPVLGPYRVETKMYLLAYKLVDSKGSPVHVFDLKMLVARSNG